MGARRFGVAIAGALLIALALTLLLRDGDPAGRAAAVEPEARAASAGEGAIDALPEVDREPRLALEEDAPDAAPREQPAAPAARAGRARRVWPDGGYFGSVPEVIASERYNPDGVQLDTAREDELAALLAELQRGYQERARALSSAVREEIDGRIARGDYDRLPDEGTVRYDNGGRVGATVHTRYTAGLGRIGVRFHPDDVPAVKAAFRARREFLESAEEQLVEFFAQ